MSSVIYVKSLLNRFEKEAIEVGRVTVLEETVDNFSLLENSKKQLSNTKIQLIENIRSIIDNNHHIPLKIENSLISQDIINYCKKWGVDVRLVESDDYLTLRSNMDFYNNPHNNIIGVLKNDIYVSNKIKSTPTKNPIEKIILHELTHICMNVRPDVINEHLSPFNNIWHKFCIKNNIGNFPSLDYLIRNSLLTQDEFNNFEKYLIKFKLFDESGNETFDHSNVVPEMSWLNIKL
jgi:hypothetical protein